MLLLFILQGVSSNLFLSILVSRVVSASLNYILNRQYVFSKRKSSNIKGSLPKYVLLAVTIMLLNYEIINFYIIIGVSVFIAKILAEGTLFLFSY